MLVSCLCPTYNRAPNHLHLVEEAVESFLGQRLPEGVYAELVVLNDTPGQGLICNHELPNKTVRIVNTFHRYNSLGEKRNALCQMAYGQVFFVWDDDDISLPGRIEQALEAFRLGVKYFNPKRSWWLDCGTLHRDHNHGYCHNASAFTREAWEEAGRYPHVSGNEDAIMDGRLIALESKSRLVGPVEDPARWEYIYRWGVSPRHLSGVADGPADEPHANHYRRIGDAPVIPGTFVIYPAWRQDYQALCDAACRASMA